MALESLGICSSVAAVAHLPRMSNEQRTSIERPSNPLVSIGARKLRQRICTARVACSPRAEQDTESTSRFTTEDWQFLGKGLVGCTAGAGVIKYGSILLPQITQPSLPIALLMIIVPTVVTMVLLSVSSSAERESDP